MYKSLITAITILLLSACGQQDIEDSGHVWKDQVDTLDKARAVEDTLDNAAQKRRDAEQEAMH